MAAPQNLFITFNKNTTDSVPCSCGSSHHDTWPNQEHIAAVSNLDIDLNKTSKSDGWGLYKLYLYIYIYYFITCNPL